MDNGSIPPYTQSGKMWLNITLVKILIGTLLMVYKFYVNLSIFLVDLAKKR